MGPGSRSRSVRSSSSAAGLRVSARLETRQCDFFHVRGLIRSRFHERAERYGSREDTRVRGGGLRHEKVQTEPPERKRATSCPLTLLPAASSRGRRSRARPCLETPSRYRRRCRSCLERRRHRANRPSSVQASRGHHGERVVTSLGSHDALTGKRIHSPVRQCRAHDGEIPGTTLSAHWRV